VQISLGDAIQSIDQFDDFWISKIIAFYDLRAPIDYLRQKQGHLSSPTALFLIGTFSDLSEIFPRDTSNPLVGEAFESLEQSLRNEKAAIKALFDEEGFDDKLEITVKNQPGTSWSGYGGSS
jgi:hypothetical protein